MGRFVHTLHRQVGRLVDHLERPVPRPIPDVQPFSAGRDVIPVTIAGISGRGAPASEGVWGGPPSSDFVFAPSDIDVLDPPSLPTLPEVEDGRRFTFDSAPPLRRRSGSVVRLRTAKPVKGAMSAPPHGIAVEAKDDVIMCIRRKMRRGVILALGQGGGYHRPPRRSPNSDIWCQ